MRQQLAILNIVQALAACNETLFRFLVAFYLISLQGILYTSQIMALTGALFIIPFLLFSTLGGLLADRFDKSKIIKITRLVECILFALAFLVFTLQLKWGILLVLFLLATTSAIFSPTKYAIIPEIYQKERLPQALSIISSCTYIGIIIGTVSAPFLLDISNLSYPTALTVVSLIALISFLSSLALRPQKEANPRKRIPSFIYNELFFSFLEMHRIHHLGIAALTYGYFLFIGGFVQLNIIPFANETLQLRTIDGGYLFLVSALGIGCGSYFASKLSNNRIKLKLIPVSGLFISLFLFLLGFAPKPLASTLIWLIALGFFGGIFIVQTGSYILSVSPNETRGRNFSTANFFSFLFVLLAALTLYWLHTTFGVSPSNSFIVIAIINTLVMLLLFRAFRKNV